MSRILALDLGEKRIGVAISDPTLTIAQPLKTIPFKSIKILVEDLKKIVKENDVVMIIIGFPLTLKGKFSEKTIEVQKSFEPQ